MSSLLPMFAWNLLVVVPLAAAVWLACRAPALRRRPATVHLLWLLVLAKFITPLLVSVPMTSSFWSNSPKAEGAVVARAIRGVHGPGEATPATSVREASGVQADGGAAGTIDETLPGEAAYVTPHWRSVLNGVIVASLSVTIGAWLAAARQYRRTNRLLRGCCVAEGRAADALRSAAQAMGVRRVPRLAIVEGRTSPVLWGAPRGGTIVLSREIADGLDDESLQLVLAHEIAHLIRGDGWSRLFAFFVTTLFWWHPVAWLARRELHASAEACCDALAIARLRGSRRRYAQTLLDLADSAARGSRFKPVAAAIPFGEVRTLAKRIALVAEGRAEAHVSRPGAALAMIMAAGLLVAPTRADEAPPSAADAVAGAEDDKAADDPGPEPLPQQDDRKVAADELAGRVVDEAGQPLEGVLVDLWTWYPGNETTTDADGRFRVKSGQPREQAQLRFSKEGFSPYYVDRQQQGVDNVVVAMNDKTYLEGTLLSPDGERVKGATIRAGHAAKNENDDTIGMVPTTTTTDDQGRYKMYVFPEMYEVQVAVPGVGAARLPGIVVTAGEGKSLDIQLEPAVRFEAHVVDAESKEPFAGLVLWNWQDRRVIGVSDEAGRIVIDGMMPGDYEFNVGHGDLVTAKGVTFYLHGELGRWWSADGVREWDHKRMEPDGWQRNFDDLSFKLSVGMKPVTIEVERGVTFSGHVYDPDGKPVAGATVAPAKTGSGNSLTGDTRYSVRTEADGSYRAVMPAGNGYQYNLIAHDGDYDEWRQWANGVSGVFSSKPGDEVDGVDVTLTRPATVRGRVVAPQGVLAAGKQVRAQAEDGKENRYYDPTTEVRTGDDGTFELKFIRPGRHSIQIEPFWLPADQAPAGTSVVVDVKEGEVREGIELKMAPRRPVGTVVDFSIPE